MCTVFLLVTYQFHETVTKKSDKKKKYKKKKMELIEFTCPYNHIDTKTQANTTYIIIYKHSYALVQCMLYYFRYVIREFERSNTGQQQQQQHR